jgi:quinohemoprotein ethanol dehydrogenase
VDPKSGEPRQVIQGNYEQGPKVIFPSWWGGHNWQPMAYSPQTQLVYIPAMEASVIFTATPGAFEYQRGGQNYMMNGILPIPGPMGVDGTAAAGLPPAEALLKGQPDPRPRGFLRAWDPIQKKLAWEVETSGPWLGGASAMWNGGGVMATGGGLVFQGRATGELAVLDAESGRALHAVDIGTGMMAAPMTYSSRGQQYVAVMTGVGGSLGTLEPPGSAAYRYGNRGRIIVLKLDGGPVPHPPERAHEQDEFSLPTLPRQGTATMVQQGASLFMRNCARCHPNNGEGSIPDLRRMSSTTHAQFSDILLKGIRADRGMGNYSDRLSENDVEALHDYLIDLEWQSYEGAHADPLRH